MSTLGVRAVLALGVFGGLLPQAAAKVDILQLGGLFTDEDAISTFSDLKKRDCLPADFSAGGAAVVAADCIQRDDCPGIPKDMVFYNCLARGVGLIEDDKFNGSALVAAIAQYTSDTNWSTEKQLLMALCLATLDTNMTAGQQAADMFTCWQWSLLLDCDLHELGQQLSGEASRHRAAFLAGDCALSPRHLLVGVVPAAANRSWEDCGAELKTPDNTETDEERHQLDSAAISLVSCVLRNYTDNTTGNIDLDTLKADINSSEGDEEAKEALLGIVKSCDTGSGITAQEFVVCWAMHGIMSCAGTEASVLAHKYQLC